jgi:hypothetical protein
MTPRYWLWAMDVTALVHRAAWRVHLWVIERAGAATDWTAKP